MSATILDLHHLERLLQTLGKLGWEPFDVMQAGAWQSSTSIPAMLKDIVQCDPPVLRMLKDGTQTGLVKLAWGLGPTQLVQDHSESSGFDEAIAKARDEVEHSATADLLDRLLMQIDASGSEHYQESTFGVQFSSVELDAVVTLQRRDQPTPHQLRMLAEADRDRLRGELEALQGVIRAVNEQFRRFGERFPDGFDKRVFSWVEDAAAASHEPEEQSEISTVH
ncbi:hypothetical protein ACSVIJ_05090 [Pseudomonas sp. NCHU5208]|uniref:hypothetical protein n=1 Tax=unclassified Pseudomonas TaxID=196821 RepID=UPI003F9B730D